MSRALFRFPGRFQWWTYTVAHGQLLLRRTKSPEWPTQVDVLFKDVMAVNLPTAIDDLVVTEKERGEVPDALQLDLQGRKLFVVQGNQVDGYVVAGAAFSDEGDHDYHDPSPLLPQFPPPRA